MDTAGAGGRRAAPPSSAAGATAGPAGGPAARRPPSTAAAARRRAAADSWRTAGAATPRPRGTAPALPWTGVGSDALKNGHAPSEGGYAARSHRAATRSPDRFGTVSLRHHTVVAVGMFI